jgi:tetratricopeptide (TPR) repeat protein
MSTPMPEDVHAKILEVTRAGNELAAKGDLQAAFRRYWDAFELLPEPKLHWEASTWILTAVGDMLFLARKFQKAKNAFEDAVLCPGGLGNPFIHLRLGQIALELGDEARAADELARAYMSEGRSVFADEDPKYWDFLRGTLRTSDGVE